MKPVYRAQEAETCIRGARRKGADILSSTTEDGEEHLLRHHEDQPGGDDGGHCAGDEEAEAEDSGAEDQVGGGVDQCALQYILQDGLHQRGAPVQGQGGSTAAANEGDGEGTAGGGGGQAGEEGAAAHRVPGRAEGGAAGDRGDDGRRGGGDRPQGDGVVPGEPRGHAGHASFMKQFEEEHEYGVVKLVVDYCAWDHYYMKPTHIWTSMLFWEPKGVQEDGVGRCRGQCKYGSIGEKGKWVHEHAIGQESSRVYGGEGRQTSKGAVPVDLHREIVRVRRAYYRKRARGSSSVDGPQLLWG